MIRTNIIGRNMRPSERYRGQKSTMRSTLPRPSSSRVSSTAVLRT